MNKTTVLVVENEAIVAADLASKLRQLGYEVAGIAAEGEEAVALAIRIRPHLVLMDIRLGGSMDGIEAAEAIRRQHDVPVIYLTAHSDAATLARAKLTGPFGYILKPFEERELATQIELALYKHQADREIREQREWLRVTLTSIGDGVIATDGASRVTFLNPVAESLTGWKAEEATGLPLPSVFRIVNEQTGEPLEDPVERVLREGRAVALANHAALVTRDGRRVPIEDSAAPILDAAGQAIGAVLVFHDVTEKRRAEDALRESEARARLLSETRGRLLASENPQAIVHELCRRVMEHLDCQAFFNFLSDEPSGKLHLNACAGIPEEEASRIEWLDYGVAVCGCAARDGVRIVAEDICSVADPRTDLVKSYGILAYACHPLMAEGRVLGTLSFGTKHRTHFSPQDLALMKTVADHVAIAMERVRLAGELQESRAKLEARVLERTTRLAQANRSLAYEITRRTRAQESLEEKNALLGESEARLRQIIDSLPVYVYAKDRDGRFILANRMTAEAFGCLPSEVEGRTYAELVPEIPESAAHLRDDREVIETGRHKFISEETLTLGPGRVQILQTTKVPLVETGAGPAVLGVSVDITELREIENALRRSEVRLRRNNELLQKVFDGITDPLVMLDSECLVTMINKAATDYYGVGEGMDVFGKPCFHGLRGRDAACPECDYPFLSAGTQTVSFERKGLSNAGRVENATVYPVLDEQGRRDAAIVKISDVTQAKILERQILQNEKMASLGLVTSGIAHEINNPNSFIHFNIPILKKYLEALLPIVDEYAVLHPEFEVLHMSYGELREDIFKLLENMEHGSQRISKIVGVLKSYVRERDSGGMRQVDLKQLVNKVMALCHTEMKHKIRSFDILIPEDLPPLNSDPEALEQVLLNLLINAIHACDKPDSRVSLKVEHGLPGRDGFIIEVRDNGSGIEEAIRERIFDPFFTTKSPNMGTGLGLYICHNHVESLGGRIEVESSVGRGTTFRVVLPQTGEKTGGQGPAESYRLKFMP